MRPGDKIETATSVSYNGGLILPGVLTVGEGIDAKTAHRLIATGSAVQCDDFSRLKVAQLKDECDSRGIDTSSAKRKADYIALLKAE